MGSGGSNVGSSGAAEKVPRRDAEGAVRGSLLDDFEADFDEDPGKN